MQRAVESKKRYDRKKSAHAWKKDSGMSAFVLLPFWGFQQGGLPLPALPAPAQAQRAKPAQAEQQQGEPQRCV